MVTISKRLKAIASFVQSEMIIGDIGSDHGLLPAYLLENKLVSKVYASDNKRGPYLNLAKTLSSFDSKQYHIALEDGLNNLPDYVNTIILCGMGGDLIIDIIMKANNLNNIKYFILSPHNNIPKVRKFLNSLNYKIIDEKVVYDDKYYEIIKYQKGTEVLSEIDYEYGPINLKNKDETFINYYQEKLQKLLTIYSNNDISHDRKKQIEDEINKIRERVLNELKETY